jgi:hypothetical protein
MAMGEPGRLLGKSFLFLAAPAAVLLFHRPVEQKASNAIIGAMSLVVILLVVQNMTAQRRAVHLDFQRFRGFSALQYWVLRASFK